MVAVLASEGNPDPDALGQRVKRHHEDDENDSLGARAFKAVQLEVLKVAQNVFREEDEDNAGRDSRRREMQSAVSKHVYRDNRLERALLGTMRYLMRE